MAGHQKLLSLAYYLPQFHEIEENNRWWGKGFTEWTQLREAKAYFKQQKIRKPIAPFSEYSLLNPDVFTWQNKTAHDHGIIGFLVFDYWFGAGKTLLETPMQMVLEKQLDFDYCLCWANHTWFNKRENVVLIQQQYLGVADYTAYFYRLLPHFKSSHYIKIGNKPIYAIFNPKEIPDLALFVDTFRALAKKEGFDDLYLIAENTNMQSEHAYLFDRYTKSASVFKRRAYNNLYSYCKEKLTRKFHLKNLGPFKYDYLTMVNQPNDDAQDSKSIPTVFTGWDTSPRHLRRGTIYTGFDIDTFKKHLSNVAQQLAASKPADKLVIIKSWNEWAEGNLLEPDSIFGFELLAAYKKFVGQITADD
jgi:Glycosyltransferase WbsX